MVFSFLFLLLFFFIFLVSVAYATLLERHILGLSQERLGPLKSGYMGFVQPFMDGLKLFQKSEMFSSLSCFNFCFVSPVIFFCLLTWQVMVYSSKGSVWSFDSSLLCLVCLVGVTVYVQFMVGYLTNSKYALLGSIRIVVQSISYEIPFFFFLFSIMMMNSSYSTVPSVSLNKLMLVPLIFLLVLLEVGRAPFDLSEGESELVSGYHIEYSGVLFVFLFLSEYGVLVSFSVLFSSMLLKWDSLMSFPCAGIMVSVLLFCRSVFPRIRYDSMSSFCWVVLLPVSMHSVLFFYLTIFR